MGMLIKSMMTPRPVTVQMDDPIEIVKKIFEKTGFHHLLVLDKRVLVGIISDRDLLKTLSPYLGTEAEMSRDVATLEKRAHQIMTRTPITITAEQNIYDALEMFLKYKLSCLPVVNEEGRPVGILSWRDIFRTVHERRQKKLAKLEAERLAKEKEEMKAQAKAEKERQAMAKAALDEIVKGRACALPTDPEMIAAAGMVAAGVLQPGYQQPPGAR
tara:strand:- start:894 stop:1538 length:645 start_codon:yes stop_codon:yes gene_type:complete